MSWPFEVTVPYPPGSQVSSNYISTTKYSLITFLPVALLSQFRRYANIYFLACAILQSIPIISPLQPFSAVAPLIFVLSLSLARQGYEDYKRWRSDEADNSQLTVRMEERKGEVSIKWQDVRQGDCIKIQKDQTIPADLLVLMASSTSGICYAETASLDGEKNLKPKMSNASIQRHYNEQPSLNNFSVYGRIVCSAPSAQLDAFEGRLQLSVESVRVEEAVNRKNMLLRGCKLRNTQWVIGIVVYTGKQTGIMMNGSQPFTKTSRLEQRVNSLILALLAFEIAVSLASAGFCYYSCLKNIAFQGYLTGKPLNCLQTSAISLGSYFILYSSFIPISLIVSLQFVKVFQGGMMSGDRQMYCGLNKRSLECRTVSINEQLGQVEYILTDKTGTLTCNRMDFRNIIVGDDMYGQNLNFADIERIDYEKLSARYSVESRSQNVFDTRRLSYDYLGKNTEGQFSKPQLIQLIFLAICTCHECVPTAGGGFEGPSPDEVALLRAAERVGFRFISCQNKVIKVQYRGKIKSFELLKLIQFDSDRKRMTVVLKDSEGNLTVFTKGADTSITRILSSQQMFLNTVRSKTEQMSRTGLRSLWFAYKSLPSNVDTSILSQSDIQSELFLLGATGIQDKLQDFVGQTIYSLRSGGIKFIMLTGDKLQTAQNIALSCRLIEKGALIKNKQDLQAFISYIDKLQNTFQGVLVSPVIDGSSINFNQNETNLQLAISKTKSAVFCRVTPGQKAEIVKLVKKMGKLTLAIGDGANDVNMIMEANVGVGIFGEQGTRAAQVANYAIGQFCLLWKLLLFYGRLNYIRISQMILYFFYKNTVFTIIQFAFCFYSMGSGQSFWLSWSITFFNMIFTFFPVVLRAVFQIDLQLEPSKETFHQLSQGKHDKQILYSYYPKMYYISQKNKVFTKRNFLAWQLLGVFQGAICLLVTLYAIAQASEVSGINSYQIGFYLVEISAYTSVIIVVTIKLAVNVKHWTLLLVLGFLVPSIGAYVVFTFISQFFQNSISYRDMIDLLSMPSFYFVQFMCIGSMFCFDFFLFSIEATKNNFENYLKNKTLKSQRLSESNLNKFILEMTQMDENHDQHTF